MYSSISRVCRPKPQTRTWLLAFFPVSILRLTDSNRIINLSSLPCNSAIFYFTFFSCVFLPLKSLNSTLCNRFPSYIFFQLWFASQISHLFLIPSLSSFPNPLILKLTIYCWLEFRFQNCTYKRHAVCPFGTVSQWSSESQPPWSSSLQCSVASPPRMRMSACLDTRERGTDTATLSRRGVFRYWVLLLVWF